MYMILKHVPSLENASHYTDRICTRHVMLLRRSPSPHRRMSQTILHKPGDVFGGVN